MKRIEPGHAGLMGFEHLAGESRLVHFFTTRLYPGDLTDPAVRQAVVRTMVGEGVEAVVPRQVHGNRVEVVTEVPTVSPAADALVTGRSDLCIGILVADCFPLLIFDPVQPAVAVVHAGWRGTAADIQGHTVRVLQERYAADPRRLRVVIGPGIGPCCFEVGGEVVDVFRSHPGFDPQWAVCRRGKVFMDLPAVIRSDLLRCGLPDRSIHTVPLCTACRGDLFHSYRRDGSSAGRMLLGAALRRECIRE